MSAGQLLFGLDIGTAGYKAVLTTVDGAIVASASAPHSMSMRRPGFAEVDAESVWWVDTTPIDPGPGRPGRGPGHCRGRHQRGWGRCVLLNDTDGIPVRPAILYGIDMRATHQRHRSQPGDPEQTVGAAYGDALSSPSAPDWSAPTHWARIVSTTDVDDTTRELCDQSYDAYRTLYPATRSHVHLPAERQERAADAPGWPQRSTLTERADERETPCS